ncbi:MAG: UDP-N-acetylglucosamine diphosphorylase/glucosamine-1-phosphate N-acetyltransferase [Desulfonatronovibrio sp. MSAO_Bac4]|nr:MAG: UDP-N-acetylglucosamine diphosphorylase/glucosamine-1-phosphate N-acetyltransferase [Desulfonatronovibrio sp. MSAO_Bac4]
MDQILNEKAAALILAAGKGTRMMSTKPKVMHKILGKPMLWYPINTFKNMGFDRTFIVAGHGRDILEAEFSDYKNDFIVQDEQLGTGHALQISWPAIQESGVQWLVVANGDTPLVTEEHIQMLIDSVKASNADGGLLTLKLDDPQNYGRIVRDGSGRVMSVIEAKDYCTDLHGSFSGEINSGVYAFKVDALEDILFRLDQNNKQNEIYITQLISLAYDAGLIFSAICAGDCSELLGINSPRELCEQEEFLRKKNINFHFEQGVTLRNSDQIRIGPEVVIEPGADICGPCEVYGQSLIGEGTTIDSHCYIENSEIKCSNILSFSHIHNSRIGKGCSIGPFARLRPGSVLEGGGKVGNFVEIKNSRIGINSKVNHLSYIGDADLKESVNIGAGTITCNYDGQKKHKTIIEKNVFIGSNTALVAPVTVKSWSMVGAGSTITVDVPEDSLAIARQKQKNLLGKNPLKKKQNKSNL